MHGSGVFVPFLGLNLARLTALVHSPKLVLFYIIIRSSISLSDGEKTKHKSIYLKKKTHVIMPWASMCRCWAIIYI